MSLISTSISRIDFASSFFHFSYTCIIQLIEIIVILLVSIGVSSLAGVALVFLSLFVPFPFSFSFPTRLNLVSSDPYRLGR